MLVEVQCSATAAAAATASIITIIIIIINIIIIITITIIGLQFICILPTRLRTKPWFYSRGVFVQFIWLREPFSKCVLFPEVLFYGFPVIITTIIIIRFFSSVFVFNGQRN